MSNRFAGTCNGCGKPVAAGAGKLERSGYGRHAKWLVWHPACFDASDNASDEDRCCGNRAYEDRCAAAVGGENFDGFSNGW